ncbi:hypothetical protein CA13_28180 [Planctomycetes bacterium CA13]|uniref:Uncharacterized protein n=1 Tax=Novipirellula herctigrandis TaxID=2527986 RepID=A0A5C5Z2W3_9BACT|nr:hypothetical protein CA13_28180 [Planctomycetes bacterium CA13]
MSRTLRMTLAIALSVCLLPSAELLARGMGGGRGGGARGGASMSRGGASTSRSSYSGGASRSAYSGSASRSAYSGGASSSAYSGSASRSGYSGGASRTATASRSGYSSSTGRSAQGQKGSKSYTTQSGHTVTVGGARGGVNGPSGNAAGRAGGVKVESAGGGTVTRGGASGAARGPGGTVGGQVRGGKATGPGGGTIGGGQARVGGKSLASDAGFARYKGGVSVRGAGGATAHRTRSVTAVGRQGQGVAVRRSVGVRYGHRGGWYTTGWYNRYPSAWRAARWTAATVWAAASWNAVTSWWGPTYVAQPIYYDYGNTIVYEGDTVYNGSEPIGTAEEYYQEASVIASAGEEEVAEDEEWKSLGVWAMVKDDDTESDNILQLAVNQNGVVRGNHYNALVDTTTPVQGLVDKKTQRVAWTIGDNDKVVSETGLANLTDSEETQMLIHYGKDRTEQWTLVKLEQE